MIGSNDVMRSFGQVLPATLVTLLRDTPMSNGKVEFAWNAAVGPAVQRATAVRLEGTTLMVDVTSAQWAKELKRSERVILTRLQSLLGPDVVTALAVRR
jgi:predicted nucleic acid-binding Zn ribbon protein